MATTNIDSKMDSSVHSSPVSIFDSSNHELLARLIQTMSDKIQALHGRQGIEVHKLDEEGDRLLIKRAKSPSQSTDLISYLVIIHLHEILEDSLLDYGQPVSGSDMDEFQKIFNQHVLDYTMHHRIIAQQPILVEFNEIE